MNAWSFNFERLQAWQKSRELCKEIYKVTKTFPPSEQFGLVAQVRRAAVSVSSNLAEGMSRTTPRDQVRFVEIAYGSLMEVFCQIILAGDAELISADVCENLRQMICEVAAMLSGLRKSIVRRAEEKH